MANTPDGSVVIDTQLDNTGFEAGSSKLQKATNDLVGTINRTGTKIKPLGEAAVKGFNTKGSVDSFVKKLDAAELKIKEAEEALQQFGQSKFETDSFKEVLKDIEKTEAQLSKLDEKMIQLQDMEVDPNSKQFLNLSRQIELTKERLQDLQIERQMMVDSGEAYISGKDTEEYKTARQQLEAQRAALTANRAIINSEAIEQARLNVLAAQEQVATAKTAQDREKALATLQNAQAEYNAALQGSAGAKPVSQETESSWSRFGGIVRRVGEAGLHVVKNLGAHVWNGIKGAVSGATSAFSKLFKTHKKSDGIVQKLTHSLFSLKSMLVSRVKRMFIGEIFKELQSGIQSLALFSDDFNQAMSNMKNSMKELALNFVTALGSGIRAVEPVVTRLMNTLSSATKYASTMIAALAGQSTIITAKKQTASYADSLKDATTESKKLANATLTTYDQIHKVGEATAGTDNTDANGTDLFEQVKVSDVLNNMPDYAREIYDRLALAFKTQRWKDLGRYISYGLNKAIEKVDEAFIGLAGRAKVWTAAVAEFLSGVVEGFNATKLGQAIADGLKLALDVADTFFLTFNWAALGTKLTDGINAVFADGELWASIGDTIAHGLNAVVSFALNAATNLNWEEVGTAIATALNHLADSFNFFELGQTIGRLFEGLVESVRSFVTTLDWAGLGTHLSDLMNGMRDQISLTDLVDTVQEALLGLITSITTFFSNQDWEADGEELAKGLIRMIKGVDAKRIGEAVDSLLRAALDLLNGFVKEWNAEEFGLVDSLTDIMIDFFDSISWWEISKTVLELMWNAVKAGVKDFISLFTNDEKIDVSQLISTDGEEQTILSIAETGRKSGRRFKQGLAEGLGKDPTSEAAKLSPSDLITAGDDEELTEQMQGVGRHAGEGLKQGAAEGLGKDSEWTGKSGIFTKVTDLAKEAYDIHSPSKVFEDVGENLVLGLKKGIDGSWGQINTTFKASVAVIKSTLDSAWVSVKNSAASKWRSITTDIIDYLNRIKTAIDDTYNYIGSKDFRAIGQKIPISLLEGMKSKWGDVSTALNDLIVDTWTTGYNMTNFTLIGEEIIEGMMRGIDNKRQDLLDYVQSLMTDTETAAKETLEIASPSKVFTRIGGFVAQGLAVGIDDQKDAATRSVAALARNLTAQMDDVRRPTISASVDIADAETRMLSRLDGVSDRLAPIAERFSAIADAIASIGTVRIPAVVTGNYVPEQLRLSRGGTVVRGQTAGGDQNTAALLRQLIELLGGGEDGTRRFQKIEIPVSLNGRQIGAAQAEYDRVTGRLTNGGRR